MPRLESALVCHPAVPDPALSRVAVSLAIDRDTWRLCYRLTGALDRLRLPAAQLAGAADGLWRHTCCEAFVAVAGAPAYREFNFSPSGQWAAYAFHSPRRRDDGFRPPTSPRIAWQRRADWSPGTLELVAELDAALLPAGEAFDVGVSLVAEDIDGRLAYWALAHPSPQPDFHHRAAFALRVTHPPESTA